MRTILIFNDGSPPASAPYSVARFCRQDVPRRMPFCLPREFLPMTARSRDIALVADIGGTNARFALADTGNERPLREDSIRRYAVSDFATLTEAAGHYLDTIDIRPCHAVLAVAGHIRDG